MNLRLLPLALIFVFSGAVAVENKVDKAVAVVKELCLSGTQFDLKTDVKGNLTLTKLTPGAEGSASVNVRSSSGAAAIFDDKVRAVADENIRSCIKPYIPKIIDAILKDNSSGGAEGAKKKKI